MPLCLTGDGETVPVHVDEETGALRDGASATGTTFHLHIPPATWWDELEERNTKAGKVDREGRWNELWPAILKGWDRLYGPGRKLIEYDPGAVLKVAALLPVGLADALYVRARRPFTLRADALGN